MHTRPELAVGGAGILLRAPPAILSTASKALRVTAVKRTITLAFLTPTKKASPPAGHSLSMNSQPPAVSLTPSDSLRRPLKSGAIPAHPTVPKKPVSLALLTRNWLF